MSKLILTGYFGNMASYLVSDALIASGWKAGQFAMLDESNAGYIGISDGTDVIGMLVDDPSELATAPSGSRVTVAKAQGSYLVSHADEVAAGSAVRCYSTGSGNPESGTLNDLLYVSAAAGPDLAGKLTTDSGSSPVVAVLTQVPSADNDYTIGFDLRI